MRHKKCLEWVAWLPATVIRAPNDITKRGLVLASTLESQQKEEALMLTTDTDPDTKKSLILCADCG